MTSTAAVDELARAECSSRGTTASTRTRRASPAGKGPNIAWFKDPAGNVLSVLEND